MKMNELMKTLRGFAKDDDGAQVIEYALIIAVVSIALIVLLHGLTNTTGGFSTFINRVGNCLTNSSNCS
jgi:pilus assembly protein Flp/PilA